MRERRIVSHPSPENRVIDLNADVGEGSGEDAAIFGAGITSANVACGAHAGDAATMAACCTLAARYSVALGAHPGYADRARFGRLELPLTLAELGLLLEKQLRALGREAEEASLAIRHVKPHGALYHFLNRERAHAACFVESVRVLAPGAAVFGPPAGELRKAAEAAGLRFVPEGFIDRGYRPDGGLVPRGEPGGLLAGEAALAQALALARAGRVRSLCVHGDGPEAARLLAAARVVLVAAGFRIAAPEVG